MRVESARAESGRARNRGSLAGQGRCAGGKPGLEMVCGCVSAVGVGLVLAQNAGRVEVRA